MRHILGIDPGLAQTGWGVLQVESGPPKCIGHGCIGTSSGLPVGERLKSIYKAISDIAAKYSPDIAAVESIFFHTNQKTIIPVAQAKGVIILSLWESGIDFREYSPLEIKLSLTGIGRASKEQVQKFVKMILGLDEIPKPNHAADALAAAICAFHSQGAAQRGFVR